MEGKEQGDLFFYMESTKINKELNVVSQGKKKEKVIQKTD